MLSDDELTAEARRLAEIAETMTDAEREQADTPVRGPDAHVHIVLSDDELARLRALCDEATPGPWVSHATSDHRGMVCVEERSAYWVETVAECYCGAHDGHGAANAAFVAAARTALPALLDAHARLLTALETISAGAHHREWVLLTDSAVCAPRCPACLAARALAEVAT